MKGRGQGIVGVLAATLLCCAIPMRAQDSVAADTVLWFAPGVGQSAGQGPVFFPRNILGFPDTSARSDKPAVDPRSVCSIGLGGDIVLGFSGHAVTDGPGIDLVVYENAFRYGSGRVYAEPAVVQVSTDGRTWTPFPCDSVTLHGCAGVTPTDPRLPNGGGDGFDLAAIGVDSVRWIRITDITQSVLDRPDHAFYDPTLSGFDLDAVVALHGVAVVDAPQCAFDAAAELLTVGLPPGVPGVLRVFDLRGTLLLQRHVQDGLTDIDGTALPVGYLLVHVVTPTSTHVARILR